MSYEQIAYEVADGIATITLERRDCLNAWTPQMAVEQIDAITTANADPDVGAIVLTGAGRGFCAGADIRQVMGQRDQGRRARGDTRGLPPGFDWPALLTDSVPIVAAINGVAIGVGVTMWLSADYVVAGDTARFGMGFIRLGLVPELGATRLLVDRVGPGAANRLLLSGDLIDADRALAIGLVDEVVATDVLASQARTIAASFGRNPPGALLETKRLVATNRFEPNLGAVQEREQLALERCARTDEHRAAVRAFLDRPSR